MPHEYRIGDAVRVVKIPPDLHDAAQIGTPGVFARALGGTFQVQGINEIGWLELEVVVISPSRPHTIWIEPEFVEPASVEGAL